MNIPNQLRTNSIIETSGRLGYTGSHTKALSAKTISTGKDFFCFRTGRVSLEDGSKTKSKEGESSEGRGEW